MSDTPAGFAPHFRKSPVTDPWEPLLSREVDGTVQIGLRVREAHCNSRGFVHGGVIAALADNAMGLSLGVMARAAAPEAPPKGFLTIGLSLDYLASARLGQWLQVEPRVLRLGRSMGFTDALVTADGAPVARASASFTMAG
jgi:uncharacterized protein (TIGR00369 family)